MEYGYSLTGEDYCRGYRSKKKTIKEAKAEAKIDGAEKVYIGVIEDFGPVVDVENVIYRLQEGAYDFAGEYSLDWLTNVKSSDLEELEDMLTATLNRWLKKHSDYKPSFFIISDSTVETYRVDNE